MRRYIRHPLEFPIEYQLLDSDTSFRDRLRDIGGGGLCFRVAERIEPGATLRVTIGEDVRRFSATARVIWCHQADGGFDVGVRFSDEDAGYAMRMAEQVCHIQNYKQEVLERYGRHLSDKEAADEWIARFAARFPS